MKDKLARLLDFANEDLHENLLPWWIENMPDEENGGFYGAVDADNRSIKDADKFIVLHARLIWTFAAAFRVTKKEEYRQYAERAFEHFVSRFHDREFGGFFTSVRADGSPAKLYKHVYGNAFAVYALAEYARAFGDKKAEDLAFETVKILDSRMYDNFYQGYYEAASRDWARTPGIPGMNRGEVEEKTMNTHLHLIEAYTNLLRVRDIPSLRSRVRELLYIFLNKIINRETHHFYYFQKRDWTPTTAEQSWGHDIEGSWLLYETAQTLDEAEALRDVRNVCVNMARAVREQAFSKDGALYTDYDPVTKELVRPCFSWWEQAEAVVGCLNAWQLTGEEQFLNAGLRTVDYIEKHFIDRKYGGWHSLVAFDGTAIADVDKANGFTCPYHNARMSLEIIERLESLD